MLVGWPLCQWQICILSCVPVSKSMLVGIPLWQYIFLYSRETCASGGSSPPTGRRSYSTLQPSTFPAHPTAGETIWRSVNNESWRLLERYGYEVEGLFCTCNFPLEPSGGGRLLVGHNFLNGEKLHASIGALVWTITMSLARACRGLFFWRAKRAKTFRRFFLSNERGSDWIVHG